MKKLFLALLFTPVMASANHCDNVAEFGQVVMQAKNVGISEEGSLDTLLIVEAPSVDAQNELISVLEWAYSEDMYSDEFSVIVKKSCEEFYGEN